MGISGGGARIKSIQRGVLTIPTVAGTATATISAVNTAKAEVRFVGQSSSVGVNSDVANARLYLNNATTVGAIRGASSGAAVVDVTYEVTEWE